MYRNYPVHYYLIITLGRVIILYSARCTNIIDNNNNISVYILTSLQFQTAHNHHKMMNDSFSFLTLIISVIYSDVNLFGGGERDRTDDLLLAKQALSQLSYTPINYFNYRFSWWARVDLNYRPHAYQACALTRLSYGP